MESFVGKRRRCVGSSGTNDIVAANDDQAVMIENTMHANDKQWQLQRDSNRAGSKASDEVFTLCL